MATTDKEVVKEQPKAITTIADAEKAGYVSLDKSEKAQAEGKEVVDIITVENRKMHKLQ